MRPARLARLCAGLLPGLGAGGTARASTLQSALHPAGPDAAIAAQLAWIMLAAGAAIFAGVMLLAALSLRGARPVRPWRWIVGAGVLFPVAALTALLAFSTWRTGQLSRPLSQQDLIVGVTGKMWWWEVRYRDARGGRDVVLANEIRIPAGRGVYLGLTTSDVIHSFWVPPLAGKVDMVPGRVNGLTVRADRPGTWRGQCAEFCGEQHARMALHVIAMAPADYEAWFERERSDAAPPANAWLARGRAAFLAQRCNGCHTIRGVAEAAQRGAAPDLTHVGGRTHLAAGTLAMHRGALVRWIGDPQAVKPGVRMPAAAGLDSETLRALADYLDSLK
jgi:cytochrome c oxidase subunit 2